MAKENWKKTKASSTGNCWKCRKEIEKGEECYVLWSASRVYNPCCVECHELKIRERVERYIDEVGKLREKETKQLTKKDHKKIKSLKKETEELSKQEFEDVWISIHVDLLKNSLQELEQEINNPSQSKTQNNQESLSSNNNQNSNNNDSNGSNGNDNNDNRPLSNDNKNSNKERESKNNNSNLISLI